MTVENVANELVKLCREGKWDDAQANLYADNARSIEPHGEPLEVQGREALNQKGEWFNNTFEVHTCEVSDPVIADNFFTCTMTLDSTHKESGMRNKSSEVCVYEVQDGKIVLEQFFYAAPPAEQ